MSGDVGNAENAMNMKAILSKVKTWFTSQDIYVRTALIAMAVIIAILADRIVSGDWF